MQVTPVIFFHPPPKLPTQSTYGLDTIDTYNSYHSSGISKYFLGNNRGAIQDFNKAIEFNPKFAATFYDRGLAKISFGQKDSGCLDLSKAGELGSSVAYDLIKEHCN